MLYKDFLKVLRDPKCNSFSDKFDSDAISRLLMTSDVEANPEQALLLLFSVAFNSIYTNFFADLKPLAASLKLPEFRDGLYSVVNRDYIVAAQAIEANSTGVVSIRHLDGKRVPSVGDTSVNVLEALESAPDALNVVLRFLSYHEPGGDQIPTIEELLQVVIKMSYYYSKKALYDYVVWEEHLMKIEDGKLVVAPLDPYEKKMRYINHLRFQESLLSAGILAIQMKDRFPTVAWDRMSRVKSVQITEGRIGIIYAKGTMACPKFMQNIGPIITYHQYLSGQKIENAANLGLNDLIYMLSVFQTVLDKVDISRADTGVGQLSDLAKMPRRIPVDCLTDLLERQGQYTLEQIDLFVGLLCGKWTGADLYERPLRRVGDDLYFSLISLRDANLSCLVDVWMEQLGNDLDKRGKAFEAFIEGEIRRALDAKGYYYHLPPSKVIEIPTGREEIDLLVELRDVIFLAEAKCIKYPMSSRDDCNMRRRVCEGAAQAKRKRDFLLKNRPLLKPYLRHPEKPILACVIINFPHFSGLQIDGIPVIDQLLITNYLSNRHEDRRIATDHGKILSETAFESSVYYHSEHEFAFALEGFIGHPRPIMFYADKIESFLERRSVKDAELDVYSVEMRIKENYLKTLGPDDFASA